jgi:hypothetical protein
MIGNLISTYRSEYTTRDITIQGRNHPTSPKYEIDLAVTQIEKQLKAPDCKGIITLSGHALFPCVPA